MEHITFKAIRLYALGALDALDQANVPQAQVELHQILEICTPKNDANHPNLGRILLSPDEIYHRVQELGHQISIDHPDGVHLVGILHASKKFVSDLARHITPPCSHGFVDLTRPDGMVTITKSTILCDTICDTGATLLEAISRFPNAKICVLINKEPTETEMKPIPDYRGFDCAAKHYPVGYGLDHNQAFRKLSFIVDYLNPTKLRSRKD